MSDSWKNPDFAKEYADNATDTDTNWYEHHVNAASLWSMIPEGTHTVLDFGCGPGDFTMQLHEKGYEVDGCDGSEAMIKLADETYPDIGFFVWDGTDAAPASKSYDVVVTKLTLHFVKDLGKLAINLLPILNDKGSVIVSVPHPMPTVAKAGRQYFEQKDYDTEIGTYGMHVTMVHRSIQGYINPFLENGYVMTGIVEPDISQDVRDRFNVKSEYADVPRRLNLRFKKA